MSAGDNRAKNERDNRGGDYYLLLLTAQAGLKVGGSQDVFGKGGATIPQVGR